MINVKAAEYAAQVPEYVGGENWVSSQEDEITVFVSGQRDDTLLGEGIMRDLARRVQALRKEMGFIPTDVLESVHIAELDAESMALLRAIFGADGWIGADKKSVFAQQPKRRTRCRMA